MRFTDSGNISVSIDPWRVWQVNRSVIMSRDILENLPCHIPPHFPTLTQYLAHSHIHQYSREERQDQKLLCCQRRCFRWYAKWNVFPIDQFSDSMMNSRLCLSSYLQVKNWEEQWVDSLVSAALYQERNKWWCRVEKCSKTKSVCSNLSMSSDTKNDNTKIFDGVLSQQYEIAFKIYKILKAFQSISCFINIEQD